eukprot:COSAG02_NODE_110_length_36062_cov_85.812106_14_plen_127_part_00
MMTASAHRPRTTEYLRRVVFQIVCGGGRSQTIKGGAAPPNHTSQIMHNVLQPDMRSDWGIRSTSSSDPRYSNANIINPYSNWRGPVWVNVNAMIIYGTCEHRFGRTRCVHDGTPDGSFVHIQQSRS